MKESENTSLQSHSQSNNITDQSARLAILAIKVFGDSIKQIIEDTLNQIDSGFAQ